MKTAPLHEIALDLARYARDHDVDPAPCLLLLLCCAAGDEPEDEPEPVPEHYYPH